METNEMDTPREEQADSEVMCHVDGCLRERLWNWSTCEEHEDRGSRMFDRKVSP